MKVFLVRHGAFSEGEEQLNSLGITQVIDTADRIRGDLKMVLSSDGPRSQQSAQIIANKLACRHRVAPWLNMKFLTSEQRSDAVAKLHKLFASSEENIVVVTNGESIKILEGILFSVRKSKLGYGNFREYIV